MKNHAISGSIQINIRSIPDQYQINTRSIYIRSISRSKSDQYHHQYQINIRPISGLITILNFKALSCTIFNIIEQHFFQSRDCFFSISDPQGTLQIMMNQNLMSQRHHLLLVQRSLRPLLLLYGCYFTTTAAWWNSKL